jgi:glycosyltransferase involved in cell wall biosynthesis
VLIAGDGPQLKELESLAESLQVADQIVFLGSIENPELPEYLNAADLYVSTSHSDGTSLSLLEAMGCALPVIVTDIESIREWVVENENGLLTPIGNPEKLSAALITALSDESLRKRASANNLDQARTRANWDINFTKLESMYEKVINNHT